MDLPVEKFYLLRHAVERLRQLWQVKKEKIIETEVNWKEVLNKEMINSFVKNFTKLIFIFHQLHKY